MTYFDDQTRDLIAHAYQYAPAITAQLNAVDLTPDDVQSTDDLAKIPVISKDDLVKIHQENPPFGGFLTVDPDTLPRVYISPGPIFDPQPPPDDPSLMLEPFQYIGAGKGDRVLNTFTYHLTPAGILLDELLRLAGATVLPTGPGNTELQIDMTMALGATGFVGQPSYLMTMLDKAEDRGLTPDTFPIKKALFSAEPYTPSQFERFEGEYGMTTTSAYGTADLGFIGYTRAGVQGFQLLRNVYIQIVDPETGQDMPAGEIGEVVATTFNKAYPLVRFGTGDLGAVSPDLLDGTNQHLLGLYGRSGDAIKVRGMFLHPNQLKAAAGQFPQINAIQAVITRPQNSDVVTLRVQLAEGASSDGVADQLKELAQSAVRLRIDTVEFVDSIDSGERTVKDERDWE